MKISEEQLGKFFIMTNPLFYVLVLIIYIQTGVEYLLQKSGISDWFYIIFKLNKENDKHKQTIKHIYKKHLEKGTKMFWLKRKAWSYVNKL